MMGVSDADARIMSLHDYEMRLWHWNEIHGDKDDEIVDPDVTQRMIDKLRARPELLQRDKGQKPQPMPARL
jgi:hypothetical protein